MRVTRCEIAEVVLLTPTIHSDDRGFFLESYNRRVFTEAGISAEFVQDNHSRSAKGVLRGLHYQLDRPQGKLVRVVNGEIFDVAVDIRLGSPTFGRWVGATLNDANKQMLWIPAGFAHGFVSLSDTADVLYKATGFYDATDERGIRWDDPTLAIDWPLTNPTLSSKDRLLPIFSPDRSDLPRFWRG